MATPIQRGVRIATLGAFAALSGTPAFAADKELLDMLLQNGAINQSQYDQLLKKETLTKKDVDDIKIKLDHKGLQFETADEQFKFKIGGRLHADASWHNDDDFLKNGEKLEANDGTEIRRGRLKFEGTMWEDWGFVTQIDFADNSVAMKDLFLQYTGLGFGNITAGQQKQPFSHELQMSSNDLMFQERSLADVLAAPVVDRAIGLRFDTGGDNWTYQLGAYGETIEPNKEDTATDEGWGVASRATFNPILEKDKLIHLGVAGAYRATDGKATGAEGVLEHEPVRFRWETTHMSNIYLVDTGSQLAGTDNIKLLGLEAGGMYGPFSLEGEYHRTWVEGKGSRGSATFDGWYAQAAWTLTGESRKYKGGKFRRLEPAQNFSLKHGGWGAWELATRYAQVDLNDGEIRGGDASAITVALNWYMNRNVRFMAEYTGVLDVTDSPLRTASGKEPDDTDIFQLRAQWAF